MENGPKARGEDKWVDLIFALMDAIDELTARLDKLVALTAGKDSEE